MLSFLQSAGAVLLTLASDGAAMRFGARLPADAVAAGLSLTGAGVLQWRPLPLAPTDRQIWVELAIVAPPGAVRVRRGGGGPVASGRGPAFVKTVCVGRTDTGDERRTTWDWVDGTRDVRVRTQFSQRVAVAGETYASGEARTVNSDRLLVRAVAALQLRRRRLSQFGVLPPRGGGGAATLAVRRHLAAAVERLRELPGERGAGDFARSDDVVTNLEFDTTFALVRTALGCGSERAWQLALRCAQHLRDRDLDAASGLPFAHGPNHRHSAPEVGHAWLQGLLWVGLLAADDEHIVAARNLGYALAAQLPTGDGAGRRLRHFACPLLELESLLAITPDPVLERAANRLVASIRGRFDPAARTYRFGEGEVGADVYFERAWLTGGLLLPALVKHLHRRPDRELAEQVAIVRAAIATRIGRGGRGLPTHWRVSQGRAYAVHRSQGTSQGAFLLDGLARRDLTRILRRSSTRRAIDGVPLLDDPDLPTQFSLLARCDWPWR